jgi:Cadherin-like domain/Bacterial Ig-like domain/Calx-beta domain
MTTISSFNITPSITDAEIAASLLGDTTGLSNIQLTTNGDRRAIGFFQNDPFNLEKGIVLSTGLVASLVGSRIGNISTDFGAVGTTGDAISIEIEFDASSTSNQIFFQYVFGSEEFTDFSGTGYNDSFTLELNGVNLARLTNGNTVNINNLTPTKDPATFNSDYIDNNASSNPAFEQVILDGFTRPLDFVGNLIPGAKNKLVITIQDVADGIYDSAVFLKGKTLGVTQPPGVVQFLAANYSVDENNATVATITIVRTGGDNGIAGSVQLNLSDGTAFSPTDYLNEPITVNFAAGESSKTIAIPIVNDTIFEPNETVNLTLSSPSTGLTIGVQNSAVLTIFDNDNVGPTGSPTAILTGATEDLAFTISVIDLLQGFSDANGNTLNVTNLTTNNGTLVNNGNGTYQFTPSTNFNGAVNLTYDVTDGTAAITGQVLSFNVTAVNDAPTLSGSLAALATGTEDTVYTIKSSDLLAGFADVEGDVLSVAALTATNGTLTNNGNGTYSFSPNANFNGVVNLSYNVIDGNGGSIQAQQSFNLTAVNDAPTGAPTASLLSSPEDKLSIINVSDLLVGFNDLDGDTLAIANLTATNGTLVNNNNGTYGFSPIANFNGLVDLTYDVTDGTVTLAGQKQSFSVTPVNDAPTLSGILATLVAGTEDTVYNIKSSALLAGFTDVDGDVLSVAALTATNGILTNNGNGTYDFSPNANFNGVVNLSYNVIDGNGGSIQAQQSFKLTAVNDAPTGVPTAKLLSSPEDNLLTINVSDLLTGFSDLDGDTLAVANLTATNGTLVNNNNGTYGFSPTANFNGLVDLTYDVTDGTVTLAGQDQSFSVTPVNDAPTGAVIITGNPTQDFTLTASNTLADADGLGAISYQWQANGVNIAGATDSTFTLRKAQVGKNITVLASYTDGQNTFESVVSAATAAILKETIPPNAPIFTTISEDTGISNSDRITKDTTLVLSGTAEANSTVKFFRAATLIGSTAVDSNGNWSFDYTNIELANGTYSFTATATDDAGNTSVSSTPLIITVDTIAPTKTATINSMSPDTGASATDFLTNDGTSSRTYGGKLSAALVSGERLQLSIDGGAVWSDTAIVNGSSWSFIDDTDQSSNWQIQTRVIDTAGNAGLITSRAVTLDQNISAANAIALDLLAASDSGQSQTDNITNINKLTFAVNFDRTNAQAGDVIEILDGSKILGTTKLTDAVISTGVTNVTLNTPLNFGSNILTAIHRDQAGNRTIGANSLQVTYDNQISAASAVNLDLLATSDSGSNQTDNITNSLTPTFAVNFDTTKAQAGDILEIRKGSVVLGTTTLSVAQANTGQVDLTLTTALTNGSNVLSAVHRDVAGNAVTSSGTLQVTSDTAVAAPVVLGYTSTTVKGTAEANASLRFSTSANSPISFATPTAIASNGSYTINTANLSGNINGQAYYLYAQDVSGNLSSASLSSVVVGTTGNDIFKNVGSTDSDLAVGGNGSIDTIEYAVGSNTISLTGSLTAADVANKSVNIKNAKIDVLSGIEQINFLGSGYNVSVLNTPAVNQLGAQILSNPSVLANNSIAAFAGAYDSSSGAFSIGAANANATLLTFDANSGNLQNHEAFLLLDKTSINGSVGLFEGKVNLII